MAQIDADALEQYLAEVTAECVNLLEQHTTFVKQMYENGCIDRSRLEAIERVNELLSKEIERAHLLDADWLVQQAKARADITREGV
jgi:hypothetical protein